jgi:uncharacterized caspase-like protein
MSQNLADEAGIENRYAVCVGIDQYRESADLTPLKHAEENASAVDALLGRMGFEPKNRRLLLGEVATFEFIKATLTTFGAVKPKTNDLVIFYFAGYSLDVQIDEDEGTIVLASHDFDLEATRQDVEYRAQKTLRLGMVREIFEYSKSTNVLFIFDTCLGGDYELSTSGLQISINWVFANKNPGRVVISSCVTPEEYNGNDGEQGTFARYLLAALEGKAEEAKNANGDVTVGSLFKYLYNSMPQNYRPIQSSQELDKLVLL